jgi:hypothetical protein
VSELFGPAKLGRLSRSQRATADGGGVVTGRLWWRETEVRSIRGGPGVQAACPIEQPQTNTTADVFAALWRAFCGTLHITVSLTTLLCWQPALTPSSRYCPRRYSRRGFQVLPHIRRTSLAWRLDGASSTAEEHAREFAHCFSIARSPHWRMLALQQRLWSNPSTVLITHGGLHIPGGPPLMHHQPAGHHPPLLLRLHLLLQLLPSPQPSAAKHPSVSGRRCWAGTSSAR